MSDGNLSADAEHFALLSEQQQPIGDLVVVCYPCIALLYAFRLPIHSLPDSHRKGEKETIRLLFLLMALVVVLLIAEKYVSTRVGQRVPYTHTYTVPLTDSLHTSSALSMYSSAREKTDRESVCGAG